MVSERKSELQLKGIDIGSWVADTTGIYEITGFDEHFRKVYMSEVIWEESEDNTDEYTLGNERILTFSEVLKMKTNF